MREGSLAVGSNREPQIPEMGRVRQHLPTMGTLCRIDARGSPATEIGVDRQGGPHGASDRRRSTYRSIFPESQFRTDGGSVFQVGRLWNNSLIDTSARCPAARGAGTHSGYTVATSV